MRGVSGEGVRENPIEGKKAFRMARRVQQVSRERTNVRDRDKLLHSNAADCHPKCFFCGTGRNRTAVQTSSKKGFYTLSLSFGFRKETGERRPYLLLIFLNTEHIRKREVLRTDFDCFALRWKRTGGYGFFRKRR